METLNEWLWLLSGEEALSANSENMEPTWLMEDGQLPERLQQPARNMAIAARAIFKHLAALNDALTEARKEKGSDTTQIDKAAADIGFQWPCRATDGVWDLFEKETEENAPPIAKWITRRIEGKGDYIFSASPVSAAASLAATLWRRAAGAVLIGHPAFTGCI
jgi:ATP-dependent DNA helicase DinG